MENGESGKEKTDKIGGSKKTEINEKQEERKQAIILMDPLHLTHNGIYISSITFNSRKKAQQLEIKMSCNP